MIGVITSPAYQDIVREFFELFKTPWEFYQASRRYDLVLASGDEGFHGTANLVLSYAAERNFCSNPRRIRAGRKWENCVLSFQGAQLPIYGGAVTFPERDNILLAELSSGECAAYVKGFTEGLRVEIGYDLFCEVQTLLTEGQPPTNAHVPTLDLHIAFLRDLIIRSGVRLVEIPPVPKDYQFIACLTHDVDHPSIREHKWDHTAVGFLVRATLGSLRDLIRWRISVRDIAKNWLAVLKLPFVYLGLAKDFWGDFADRYLKLEKDIPSTFFLIPFKNQPGKKRNGCAPSWRAARYEARDLADIIQRLRAAGYEIGLHGIDAWIDSQEASKELKAINRMTGASETGARMHWLYYDEKSPVLLEEAGANYDSTVGYNGMVGYKAGTTQAYKPLGARRLLELPLHVMDTALFYPAHLGLSQQKASALIDSMVANAARSGGCLTVNWHDRSLAPERLWEACYRDLLENLKSRGAWFATAGQAVAWFRKRRSVTFETDSAQPCGVRARLTAEADDDLPELQFRIHEPLCPARRGSQGLSQYVGTAVGGDIATLVSNESKQ